MTTTFHSHTKLDRVMVISESIRAGGVIALDTAGWLPGEPDPTESPEYFVWPAMEVVGVETTS